MNEILNITNITNYIGVIVSYSCNGKCIKDVIVSTDSSEDSLILHLTNGKLVLTSSNL